MSCKVIEDTGKGCVAATAARLGLPVKMPHDDLVCTPPVSTCDHPARRYVRFTLSYRDVEDLLAERGLDVSYETVRRWVLKFGPLFAREPRRRRPLPTSTWHLDELAVMIAGTQFWLWRAVDDEGEVLDLPAQRGRAPGALIRHIEPHGVMAVEIPPWLDPAETLLFAAACIKSGRVKFLPADDRQDGDPPLGCGVELQGRRSGRGGAARRVVSRDFLEVRSPAFVEAQAESLS